MKQSKQRSEIAYRTSQLSFAAVTSGPNRAPNCPYHVNVRCWLLLLLSLLTAVEATVAVAVTDAAGVIDTF